ncbi:hypothetical protein M2267_001782 [Ensifer sp. KUDG1]|uniref:hypothetical protein n=1 Tax=Ensifer sp. KUDG1 TaxID=3373919 RepID=UPI003D1979A1
MTTDKDWLLLTKETKRKLSDATWIPLRAARSMVTTRAITDIGYSNDEFFCGSVAFPRGNRKFAESLGWSDIGIGNQGTPYAYSDGGYKRCDEYQYNDKEPVGVNLIFSHSPTGIHRTDWIINPDLIMALDLVQEGNKWIRPSEDFCDVIRVELDENNSPVSIEIKREFLIDYLAARDLDLRISHYRQRAMNFSALSETPFDDFECSDLQRDGGRFSLRINSIDAVFGGKTHLFRVWRTEFDNDVDAPILDELSDSNTAHESRVVEGEQFSGIRIEAEFWGEEWIEHQGVSERVRRDNPVSYPEFITKPDGSRVSSEKLNDEDVGLWLWFRPRILKDIIEKRGASLKWHTAETGSVRTAAGLSVHFGINKDDLVTVYAHDIARQDIWEQRLWSSYNVTPQGGISKELAAAQVHTMPAKTYAAETKLEHIIEAFSQFFSDEFGVSVVIVPLDTTLFQKTISRFHGEDERSLLRLAKEMTRAFSDRLNIDVLREIAGVSKAEKLGSIKLIERILASKVGSEKAREICGILVGVYDLRTGDAHPTSSKIEESFQLVGVDRTLSYLRQAEQLIDRYGYSIWRTIRVLAER